MVRIDELFDVNYGISIEFQNCEILSKELGGIPFISRTSKNNGVAGYVERLEHIEPNPANTISVACGGSVLSSFYQTEPYYSGFHILYLKPKEELTEAQMLYYCMVLECNKYKYNYGRQANRTLKEILVPNLNEIPKDFLNISVRPPSENKILNKEIKLDHSKWKMFKLGDIFEIKNGFYNKKPEHLEEGNIPFIGATEFNNGVTEYYSIYDIESHNKDERSLYQEIEKKVFNSNCITVSNNGSVGCAFYQEKDFSCTHDVNVLYLKNHTLNKFVAMFLCTIIEMEKFRWAYGRKWRPIRMPNSMIKLPVNMQNEPDYQFMEEYIKTINFSSEI